MKAIILAAGRGDRLKHCTINNKCLIPLINDKCSLDYNLSRAIDINPTEIIIVVGYKAENIINKYGNSISNIPIKYVIQNEQRGLVHALECAKSQIGTSDFFLLLGDEILINSKHKEMLTKFNGNSYISILCGTLNEDDINTISRTYTTFNWNDRILRIIEKPTYSLENNMGTGHCIFRNRILNFIDQTPINTRRGRQEKELPGLIQCAIDNGEIALTFNICSKYTNINKYQNIEEANALIEE